MIYTIILFAKLTTKKTHKPKMRLIIIISRKEEKKKDKQKIKNIKSEKKIILFSAKIHSYDK